MQVFISRGSNAENNACEFLLDRFQPLFSGCYISSCSPLSVNFVYRSSFLQHIHNSTYIPPIRYGEQRVIATDFTNYTFFLPTTVTGGCMANPFPQLDKWGDCCWSLESALSENNNRPILSGSDEYVYANAVIAPACTL